MVAIVTPRRREDFFDKSGEPTLRFVNWIEAVTKQTNVSTETDDGGSPRSSVAIFQKRIAEMESQPVISSAQYAALLNKINQMEDQTSNLAKIAALEIRVEDIQMLAIISAAQNAMLVKRIEEAEMQL